jgi:uncharacterized protein (TIGR03435 family)
MYEKRTVHVSQPSFFLVALAFSLAFCTPVNAQSSSTPALQVDKANAANPVALDAVPPDIHFDVVSFKRCPQDTEGNGKVDQPLDGDYIAYHCELVSRLVYFAYNGLVKVDGDFVGDYPAWVGTDHYEFIAKVAPEDIPAWQKLDLAGRRLVMRSMLATTLKLKMSIISTKEPVYLLTVAKSGAKLKPYKDGDQTKIPDGRTQTGRVVNWVGVVAYFQDTTMSQLAQLLGAHFDRHVVDRTGLTAAYNFSIPVIQGGDNDPFAHRPTEEDLSTAEGLADLGLHLETAKESVEKLSIDHIERPPEN